MHLLVSEFVCGGGWPDADIPASLAREGRAMWSAVIADLLRANVGRVSTTWDARQGPCPLPEHPRLTVIPVDGPDNEREALLSLSRQCDRGLVIAPETDGVLDERCLWLRGAGMSLCNADADTIRVCADKLRTYEFLVARGIPTIPTWLFSDAILAPRPEGAKLNSPGQRPGNGASPTKPSPEGALLVLKLRDGAGSQDMSLVRNQNELDLARNSPLAPRLIAQPYIPGRALSIAGLFDRGKTVCLLPLVEQSISAADNFVYHGGILPAPGVEVAPFARIVEQVAAHLPLHGYIGFDFILSEESGEPLLVEINPRLTTSYVGYREWFGPSLAAAIVGLAGERELPVRAAKSLQRSLKFSAAGEIAPLGSV